MSLGLDYEAFEGGQKKLIWSDAQRINSKTYVCGHCGRDIASESGWEAQTARSNGNPYGWIFICHNCSKPTFFDFRRNQYPGIPYGKPVKNVNNNRLNDIYEEARRTIGANCFTASVLCCRKLLMHLAVDHGASERATFKECVDHLSDNNHVPKKYKDWIDQIRLIGNEANHEVVMMNRETAEQLVSFCEILLRTLYEFPAIAKLRGSAKQAVNSVATS